MHNVNTGPLAFVVILTLRSVAFAQSPQPAMTSEERPKAPDSKSEGAVTDAAAEASEPPEQDSSTETQEVDPGTEALPAPNEAPAPPYAAPVAEEQGPALPEGMTLDEVLARAAQPPPEHFPQVIHDDRILAFFLADQFEYRVDGRSEPNVFGWEVNAWVGGDYNRIWLKPEGEVVFQSPASVESETDLLYSRLVFPFWSAQIGAQYANEWESGGEYGDRWSGVVALQGLAPGKFEVDASAYVSQSADFTGTLELEYDWRLTQRLVAQPRTELGFAFQDVPERRLAAGLTDVIAGLRLRYEVLREFAPYVGIRYEGRVLESVNLTRDVGEPVWRWFALSGVRFAFL